MTTLLEIAPAAELERHADRAAAAYADQSRHHAAAGDTRLAVMAAWASDLHALQALMWERGLGSSPSPDAQLLAVAAAVARSVDAFAQDPGTPADARAAVEAARAGLAKTFDASVHALLAQRLCTLDHLEGLPHPGVADDSGASRAVDRDTGPAPAPRPHPRDAMAVARAMRAAGREEDALRLAYVADLETVRACLRRSAADAGDPAGVTATLRWRAVTAAITALDDIPAEHDAAVAALRDAIESALGPVDAARLAPAWEPVS